MNVLIIEDEELAATKLVKALAAIAPEAVVTGITDSVEASVAWLRNKPQPDLILMDIELTDGQSFEIFNQVEVQSTVIFTTSYNEHALRAFKVNSIDYLLKPVQKEDLEAAIAKYKRLRQQPDENNAANLDQLIAGLQMLQTKSYRKRFLVKNLQRLVSIGVNEIAYFYSDDRLNFFRTFDGKKHIVDYTMDQIEGMLDSEAFFRISRGYVVSGEAIDQIHDYFGHRLALRLKPAQDKEAIVSRERVAAFKDWLGK